MTDENKNTGENTLDATPEQNLETASPKPEETEPEGTESEGGEKSSTNDEIDYEAELEAERKRGPDPLKAKEAFKLRQEKKKEEGNDTDLDEDEDRPLTRREAQELFEAQRREMITATQRERISQIADSLASSEAEKNLILEIHKNRSFPANLSLEDQLAEAHAIANRKRFTRINSELARALHGKQNTTKETASTHRDPQPGSQPKLPSDVLQSLKNSGFSYNNKDKRWEKKLPNGKTMVRDIATKQNRIV